LGTKEFCQGPHVKQVGRCILYIFPKYVADAILLLIAWLPLSLLLYKTEHTCHA
jgi:hypothetical protein